VRRGEEGSTVVFWRLRKIDAVSDTYPTSDEPDLPDRVIPLVRAYTVFNVSQVDGLQPELSASSTPTWEPEARAEELLMMSGATIRHGGVQAYS
jgi:antirestriction protein ArdC